MFDLNPLLAIRQAIRQAPLLGVTAAAASLALYLQIRPTRSDVQHVPEEQTITRARTRVEAGKGQSSADAKAPEDELPYSMDAFPGGRQFNTIYGTIQVFEWGPENGEKVLMMHGLSTPCIALGDMAKEFVKKGCRVMIFGASCIALSPGSTVGWQSSFQVLLRKTKIHKVLYEWDDVC